MAKREKVVTKFDGHAVASGSPLVDRDRAVEAARLVWSESVPTQGEWQDHISLVDIVEVLVLTFGSPFVDDAPIRTVKEWYAYKIGGFVK